MKVSKEKISKADLSRLTLLKSLCERAEGFSQRSWFGEDSIIDDSPKESLSGILQVIGTVSEWLSPEFKNVTQTQMMWACIANLRHSCHADAKRRHGSDFDLEIAKNDICVLSELCGHWLKSGEAVTPALKTEGAWSLWK